MLKVSSRYVAVDLSVKKSPSGDCSGVKPSADFNGNPFNLQEDLAEIRWLVFEFFAALMIVATHLHVDAARW